MKQSVRWAARELLRRVALVQKEAFLTLLRQRYGGEFTERVCRYADAHPGATR